MTDLGTIEAELAALIPNLEIGGNLLGLVYSPDTLDNGSQLPTTIAHKNVTMSFTDEVNERRGLAVDTMQVDLLWQLPIPHADGAESAREAENVIRAAFASLDSAVCVTIRHDRTIRRYHPKSRGWWLTTMFFTMYRER